MAFRRSCYSLLNVHAGCLFIGTAFMLGYGGSANAQTVTAVRMVQSQVVRPATATNPSAAGAPMVAGSQAVASGEAGGDEATAAEPAVNVLLTKLLAAKFERTPQSILKAWSFREPDSKTKESNVEAFPASLSNKFGSVLVFEFEQPTKFKPKEMVLIKNGETEVGKAKILSVDGKTIVTEFAKAEKEVSVEPKEGAKEKSTEKSEPISDGAQPADAVDANEKANESDQKTDATKPSADGTQSGGKDESTDEVTKPADAASVKPQASLENADKSAATDEDGDSASDKPVEPETVKPSIDLKEGAMVTIRIAPKPTDKTQDAEKEATKKTETFVRHVTMGHWDEVKSFLSAMKADEADQVYAHLLKSLAQATPAIPEGVPAEMAQQLAQMNRGQTPPSSFLTPDDILQLSEAAPKPIQVEIKVPGEEKEEDEKVAKTATPKLPPNVKLPPGMTLDSLPPEARAALLNQAGASPAVAGAPGAEVVVPSHLPALGNLISVASKGGHDFAPFIAKLEKGTAYFGLEDRIKRLTTADLLMKGGLTEHVDTFLPALDDEKTQTDLPALKVWSQLALQRYSKKKVAEWLEKAWQINQWIVAIEKIEDADKDRALTNLIELSPKVDKELGQAWLNASFTDEPERGMMILTNLGTKSAVKAQQAAMVSESDRLKLLRLQNQAVENLLKVSPEKATEWAQAMTLLAKNWLTEAETSIKHSKQNSRGQFMQIDMYGNYYWVDQNQYMQRFGGQRNPRPIKLGDMLEIMPSLEWRKHVSPSLHTQMRKITANLFLRVNEEDKAFPYIEQIAGDHPEIAKELVHEFLRIWTTNHDPNTDKKQRNPYIYLYGFDQKADAIPLTRSKQERNLEELSAWVERIRKLNLDDVDEKLLANAFTTCHSSAEVFRLEAVKAVFGELKNLKPKTIAAICQKMRGNLSANWRDIRNQEAKQTNRRAPEVQKEVLRGYDVAQQLAEEALESSPESWQLHLAKACLMYDQNAYSQTVQKSSEFSDRRDVAFKQFELAASKYREIVSTIEEKDQSTDVFDLWFYAALGACDLGKITDKTVPDLRQYPLIKQAIEVLPGNLAEIHMAKVANNMFTRMSPIKPEIKFRYLRGGFEIVGEHPRAWESRNLYDYYKDLVSEIKLDVRVDGSEEVGHDSPFGVYVSLMHTSEIERESGGFGKYVQNQNNMPFAFNYGRPTEDYRDKFSESVNQALEKHFEIMNITFVSEEAMQSVPAAKSGWRLTPYAYVLLKPLGSEIDRLAPLKLDMDFLDTSGYVVIPVESSAVVIDASPPKGVARPITDLNVTQTLDERQANESRLILEVSASAKGLVPDLDAIMDLKQENFEIVSVDDQGVLPTSFDKDSSEIQILSDRSWTVEYRASEGAGTQAQFSFSDAKLPEASVKFQRYDDADLVESEQIVSLEKSYGSFSWSFLYWLIPACIMGLVCVAGLIFVATRPQEVEQERFAVPQDVNPFTVLTLLKDIRQRNGIDNEKTKELEDSINRVEEFYFGKTRTEQSEQDLENLAKQWVHQAK